MIPACRMLANRTKATTNLRNPEKGGALGMVDNPFDKTRTFDDGTVFGSVGHVGGIQGSNYSFRRGGCSMRDGGARFASTSRKRSNYRSYNYFFFIIKRSCRG
ncbi:hypothetical protein M5689_020581 [Euphorbia peplus]|nr:hypothetical protein M5689_020581 [Euphorbia peplus]